MAGRGSEGLLPEGIGGSAGGRGLAGGVAEEVVPVLGAAGAEAPAAGQGSGEGSGDLVAGGIGVEAAEDGLVPEGAEVVREAGGEAGGGGDEGVRGQSGGGQLAGGEGVDGAFDKQEGLGRPRAGRQAEAAADLAGAGGHGAEGAGAEEFSAVDGAVETAADEDGVGASR